MEEQETYFFAYKEGLRYVVYESENFRLSELEILNLIKICYINERSKSIGKKILDMYKDSTLHREELTLKRLNSIGVKNEQRIEQPRQKKIKSR
jgi:hypothetical protein